MNNVHYLPNRTPETSVAARVVGISLIVLVLLSFIWFIGGGFIAQHFSYQRTITVCDKDGRDPLDHPYQPYTVTSTHGNTYVVEDSRIDDLWAPLTQGVTYNATIRGLPNFLPYIEYDTLVSATPAGEVPGTAFCVN